VKKTKGEPGRARGKEAGERENHHFPSRAITPGAAEKKTSVAQEEGQYRLGKCNVSSLRQRSPEGLAQP